MIPWDDLELTAFSSENRFFVERAAELVHAHRFRKQDYGNLQAVNKRHRISYTNFFMILRVKHKLGRISCSRPKFHIKYAT